MSGASMPALSWRSQDPKPARCRRSQAIALLILLVSGSAAIAQTDHKSRISRPAQDAIVADAPTESKVRIQNSAFGMSARWWRKFRNPSFCPFVICGTSCSDISGIPRIGSYTQEQLVSELTPCSLAPVSVLAHDECCMSKTVNDTYKDSCSSSGTCQHAGTTFDGGCK